MNTAPAVPSGTLVAVMSAVDALTLDDADTVTISWTVRGYVVDLAVSKDTLRPTQPPA
jgi:hypothetical protein